MSQRSPTFCFTCGSSWHAPINCRFLKQWERRCLDDSETFNWIHANTKGCLKRHGTIEKNCGCKFESCWMCMRSWDVHGYSPCNSYKDKDATDARQKSRYSLDRDLFYYNRLVGHQKSLRLERKLKTKIATKMETLQNISTKSWVEVLLMFPIVFLMQAVDILSVCPGTMMLTYALAFYLKKDNNSYIFEVNQIDLETATKQLSGFLENNSTLETGDVKSLKVQVLDKCRYVEHRRQLRRHRAGPLEVRREGFLILF